MKYTNSTDHKKGKSLTIEQLHDPKGRYNRKSITFWYVDTFNCAGCSPSDNIRIKYGNKTTWDGLFWTGGHRSGMSGVLIQGLNKGSYSDVFLNISELKFILETIGAVNELKSFSDAAAAWEYPEGENRLSTEPDKPEYTEVNYVAYTEVNYVADPIHLADYSDKSIVLFGNTYPYREKLKAAGGKYNRHLTTGPGWVFPITRKDEIKQLIQQS